jgi:hypothetical protein
MKLFNISSFLALSWGIMVSLKDYYLNYCATPPSIKQWVIKQSNGGYDNTKEYLNFQSALQETCGTCGISR